MFNIYFFPITCLKLVIFFHELTCLLFGPRFSGSNPVEDDGD
jgi:hypothetical protein